jgi:hypothetical protein
MPRLLVALCLAGAVLASPAGMTQTTMRNDSKKAATPVPPQAAAAADPARPAGVEQSEVPAELLDKIRADLGKEQGVSAADVKLVGAQAVNWPNGALGCPKPGMMYTQAIVPGYRVELEAGGKRFAYHTSTRGGFKRCDNRFAPPGGKAPSPPAAK